MKPDLDYWHQQLMDWSDWVRDGRASPGLYSTSQWPTGKPVASVQAPRKAKKQKQYFALPSPHETPKPASSRPLLAKTYPKLECVHNAVLTLDDLQQKAITLLYLYRLAYPLAATAMGLPGYKLGKLKYKSLLIIQSYVAKQESLV